ncbi:DNA repair protein RecO [Candidatus Woesebacteria bacterium RIFCSPHIGHO2_02_FULL_38_9]|uniref:DNA repair protein RecO n=1 Tax=Candidatus Woesebacteria bacterium RIFCSPHIGHO2_01_FULL_39_28 TaxID=1802496 RepID=A0A1F7YC75_9BACT|nr:MAG: DNA repair protein RecO [Candidatus Woesebacteria bacterium RIFCSPHIGHO2_01_FULL_39_28]OGM34427.1 MAG: DNA repair protein RecO [Candidatus Woesebacteria bacterium RIFCSPHIGHO2_02_FULL_38_9]OGM58005.1 MAG: DNA repair protein RecO [Candidatus Woesebacteria bacterium RIFCSPLOWO2_01_FULL_38_20]
MRPKSYSTEGIVLARKKYSEADRIISILTRTYGKMSYIAKGVRYPKSRKRGSLEVFSYIKFQAVNIKSIPLITETQMIDSFQEMRKDLRKVSVGYFFTEVIGRITRENETNEELFNILLNTLRKLKYTISLKTLRNDFTYEVLTNLGFWPKGKILQNHDQKLEEVLERNLSTIRIGKKLVS